MIPSTMLLAVAAWLTGGATMYAYLRVAKLIRNCKEHERALAQEVYIVGESKGLLGSALNRNPRGFWRFLKTYARHQVSFVRQLWQIERRKHAKTDTPNR